MLTCFGGLYHHFVKFKPDKPIISCISAPPAIWDKEINLLESTGVLANHPTPERAAQALVNLVKYRDMQFDIKTGGKELSFI